MRGADFRAFMTGQWGGLVATAYLVTPDLEAAERSVAAAYARMRRPWRWLLTRPAAPDEALRLTVRAAMSRPPAAAAPIPTGEPDAALVAALRGLTPRARAAVALHFVRGMRPDHAGAAIGEHPGTVLTYRAHGVPILAEAIGADPAAVHARLTRLAGAAAAAASPAPVAAVTARARQVSALFVVAVVVLTVAGGGGAWLLRPGAFTVEPGEGGPDGAMGRRWQEGMPEPVPGPPYTAEYEDVTIRLPDPEPRCGSAFAVSLHEPERVGRYPYEFHHNARRGDLVYAADCEGGTGSDRPGRLVYARDPGIGPDACAALLRNGTSEVSMFDAEVICMIAEAEPLRNRPLLVVRVVIESDDLGGELRFTATAWRGGTELPDATWQGP